MSELLGTCPRCGGNMYWEDDGLKCLQCGNGPLLKAQKHAYLVVNRDRILADVDKLGFGVARRKWHLVSSTIHNLRKGWKTHPVELPAPVQEPVTNSKLPELPAFSNDWAPAVQIKWLEAWQIRR